jgi:hypothetical protein
LQVGGGFADGGAVHHQAEVLWLDVLAAHLQAVLQRCLQAGLMAIGAGVDAVLHVGYLIHFGSSEKIMLRVLRIGICTLPIFARAVRAPLNDSNASSNRAEGDGMTRLRLAAFSSSYQPVVAWSTMTAIGMVAGLADKPLRTLSSRLRLYRQSPRAAVDGDHRAVKGALAQHAFGCLHGGRFMHGAQAQRTRGQRDGLAQQVCSSTSSMLRFAALQPWAPPLD